MSDIAGVRARLFRVPLDEALSDAKHIPQTVFERITATVTLEDGSAGTGNGHTGGVGGRAQAAGLLGPSA